MKIRVGGAVLSVQEKGLIRMKFSVISFNALGGNDGSTGPLSINPVTGEPYRNLFPEVTIRDMVHAERKALTTLGINQFRAVMGGALGGMRVLEWGILYPEDMDILFPMAAIPQSNKVERIHLLEIAIIKWKAFTP